MSWRGELCFPNRAGPLGGRRTGEYRLRSVFKRVCTGGSMSEGMCSSPGPLHFPIPHPVPHARLMASAASSNPSTCHARDNCGHIRTRYADRARSIAVLVRWHTCGEAMHSPIRSQIVSKHQQERVCVAKSGDRNSWFTPRTSGLCNRALGPWRPLCSGAIEVKTGICVPRLLFLLTGLGPCRSRCVASSEPLRPRRWNTVAERVRGVPSE